MSVSRSLVQDVWYLLYSNITATGLLCLILPRLTIYGGLYTHRIELDRLFGHLNCCIQRANEMPIVINDDSYAVMVQYMDSHFSRSFRTALSSFRYIADDC